MSWIKAKKAADELKSANKNSFGGKKSVVARGELLRCAYLLKAKGNFTATVLSPSIVDDHPTINQPLTAHQL